MDSTHTTALLFLCNTSYSLDLIHRLEGTKFDSQKMKNLLKNCKDEGDKKMSQLWTDLDDHQESNINDLTNALEMMQEGIFRYGLPVFIELMRAFTKGDIKVVENNKQNE